MEESDLAIKSVEFMNEKEEGLKKEHVGENCIKVEDSEDKEDISVHKLVVEHGEVVQDETVKQGEAEEVVERESEKNEEVELANESNEVVPQEVVEPESENDEVVEQDNESKELVPREVAGQYDENKSKVRAAAEEEKEEMSDAITAADMKVAGEDNLTKVVKDVSEEETEDNSEFKEGKTNNGAVDEENMELDQEHEADTSENKFVEVEKNPEEKDVDVKNGSEAEQVEGKLEGSSNDEDKKEGNNGSKKRKRKGSAANKTKGEKKDEESQTTPVIHVSTRPVRERKSVERLVASIEKDAIREIFVEKGPGVALKDIPNVAYKLSKKKNDETFKLLHTILFGRRGKAIQMKSHVSQFSGFIWHDNEEKNKTKVKEKFDKLVKEKLIDFCDVLDIPIANKVSTKKEEVVTKIVDFLASPHPTTEELHSGKTTKRKRSVGSAKISKKRRREASENQKDSGKSDSGSDGESDKEEDEVVTENQGSGNGKLNRLDGESSERKSSESEDATDEDDKQHKQRSKKTSVKVKSLAKKQTKPKIPKKPDLDDSEEAKKVDAKNHYQSPNKSSEKKGSTRKARSSNSKDEKKKRVKPVLEKEPISKVKIAAPKGKPKEEKLKPSDKVLRIQICQILKEVDFNTATFTDILKMLGKHFKTDLTPRKASIKLIIQEELTKLADAADDDEDEEQDVTPEPAKVDA